DVGARPRLGEREGAEALAARHPGQDLPPLLLAEARADAVAARDDARNAHPRARELLRDKDPEVAERGHLLPELHRYLALHRVEPVGDRQDLVHRERARRLEDRLA